jgi:hopene-associated glycosyltransferase HpnB
VGVLLHPARPWRLRPVDSDDPPPPQAPPGDLAGWPSVGVIIPARNEADLIAGTIECHLAGDYPGDMRLVVVDARSSDATADVAGQLLGARHLTIDGAPLPEGWAGKVWGMEQGVRALDAQPGGAPEWLLLTDADIHHSPDSLRALVASAVAGGVGLESRMARLRCVSGPERLLIPPFVLFFFLLYPLRWANRAGSRIASAAGGCILVRRDALAAGGGFESIKGSLIDDLAMARLVKFRAGLPTRLALSRTRVVSERAYDDLDSVWTMVRRSAFTQLRRSWLLLAAVSLTLLLMFAGPLAAVALGAVETATGAGSTGLITLALGLLGWLAMAAAAGPVTREFGLPWPWRFALPVSGLLYGAMTVDSAIRGPKGGGWR